MIEKSANDTYIDPKTGKVKPEAYLVDISYYLAVANFGVLQAGKLTNSKNTISLSQTDSETIAAHQNDVAQSVADTRNDGVDNILNNNDLTDEEKAAKISNYYGADPSQGAYGFAASAFAVSEMQWALRYGMGIQFDNANVATVNIVNYEGPCPEICTPIIAQNPYTLSDALRILSETHPFCRCVPEPIIGQ